MQQLGLSPNPPKTTSRIRELLWPDVSDAVAAETAARNGMYAGFFIAGMTALFAVLGLVPKVSLIDSVLFAVLGVGIRRMWRIAAVAAPSLYLIEQVYGFTHGRATFNAILPIIITAVFISSARAAFSSHKLGMDGAQIPGASQEKIRLQG
jgi:hypothetical protein